MAMSVEDSAICPKCGSDNTSGVENGYGLSDIRFRFICDACDTLWTVTYDLVVVDLEIEDA